VSYLTNQIDTHATWSFDEWERRALDIDHARLVLPKHHLNLFRERFERHIRHAQELEDGSIGGQAYRVKALQTHGQMMFLVKHMEHWNRIALWSGGGQ
jgi:hypothetical protein